jgi:hypothetical protein
MPVSDPDVSSIVARTAKSYDALPYASDPFAFTHPAHLGAIARLFALEAAPPAQARVRWPVRTRAATRRAGWR